MLTVTLTDEERQALLLALAALALERPGWEAFLATIASTLAGTLLYEDFKRLRRPTP